MHIFFVTRKKLKDFSNKVSIYKTHIHLHTYKHCIKLLLTFKTFKKVNNKKLLLLLIRLFVITTLDPFSSTNKKTKKSLFLFMHLKSA
jgi:hypothetical protein